MKVTVARFVRTFFHNGVPLYEAGKDYPLTEDTERRIALGDAEKAEVDAPAAVQAPAVAAAKSAQRAPAPRPPRDDKSAKAAPAPAPAPAPTPNDDEGAAGDDSAAVQTPAQAE